MFLFTLRSGAARKRKKKICYNKGMQPPIHFEELDSTNTYLKNNRALLPHGTAVYTDRQTAGRGRFNRKWVSQEGGLYFSILLKPKDTRFLANLTQLMAVSVCRALEELGADPKIKWPNDVQINTQKICGILSEAVTDKGRVEAVVIGTGVNVAQEGLDKIDQPATSLKELGIHTTQERVLDLVLEAFWQGYPSLTENGFKMIRADFLKRFAALGKEVTVKNGEKTISGTAQDVSPDGTLILRTASGTEEIYIGDLIV